MGIIRGKGADDMDSVHKLKTVACGIKPTVCDFKINMKKQEKRGVT